MVADEKAGIHFSKAQAKKFISSFNHIRMILLKQDRKNLSRCRLFVNETAGMSSQQCRRYWIKAHVWIFYHYSICNAKDFCYRKSGDFDRRLSYLCTLSKWDAILLAAVEFDGEHQNVVLFSISTSPYWEQALLGILFSLKDGSFFKYSYGYQW